MSSGESTDVLPNAVGRNDRNSIRRLKSENHLVQHNGESFSNHDSDGGESAT